MSQKKPPIYIVCNGQRTCLSLIITQTHHFSAMGWGGWGVGGGGGLQHGQQWQSFCNGVGRVGSWGGGVAAWTTMAVFLQWGGEGGELGGGGCSMDNNGSLSAMGWGGWGVGGGGVAAWTTMAVFLQWGGEGGELGGGGLQHGQQWQSFCNGVGRVGSWGGGLQHGQQWQSFCNGVGRVGSWGGGGGCSMDNNGSLSAMGWGGWGVGGGGGCSMDNNGSLSELLFHCH